MLAPSNLLLFLILSISLSFLALFACLAYSYVYGLTRETKMDVQLDAPVFVYNSTNMFVMNET